MSEVSKPWVLLFYGLRNSCCKNNDDALCYNYYLLAYQWGAYAWRCPSYIVCHLCPP